MSKQFSDEHLYDIVAKATGAEWFRDKASLCYRSDKVILALREAGAIVSTEATHAAEAEIARLKADLTVAVEALQEIVDNKRQYLRNTSLLASSPAQSSAAWDIINILEPLLKRLTNNVAR